MTEDLPLYYVATEDGMHFDMFEETNSMFEALCAYHQAINDGPEGRWLEIEIGELIGEDIEPIDYYEFTELK